MTRSSIVRAAQRVFFYHGHLFKQQFKLRLKTGVEIRIDRSTQKLTPPKPAGGQTRWIREPEVAYLRIPSFGLKQDEDAALESVKRFQQAKTIIVDVRGNSGGSTPERLLEALMERPYLFEFGNGMTLGISSKRMFFPDGSEFEGVGIRPHIEVKPTIENLRNAQDVVLERALQTF